MIRSPKFKVGDKVRVIKYGHLIWQNKPEEVRLGFKVYEETDSLVWYDMRPEKIGKEGVVVNVSITQGIPKYSTDPLGAWLDEEQLEKVNIWYSFKEWLKRRAFPY